MSVMESGVVTSVTLDPDEHDQMDRLARGLLTVAGGQVDAAGWVAAARHAWEEAPIGLRRAFREYRRDSGQSGVLLVRNLPVDAENLPDTPMEDGSVVRQATVSAATLMLLAHALGDPAAFRKEKSGALVQNVVPVPGREELQANSGSVRLTFHTENAFHPHRPDFVMLLCVRPDHEQKAELRTCSSRDVLPKLSEQAREALSSPWFVTEAPPSFGENAGSTRPHAVLTGDPDDPDLRIDEAATRPMNEQAGEAVAELSGLFENSFAPLRLGVGELAVVDNRVTVHGRSAFRPRYDGRDRWLQRTFVLANLRASRSLRAGDGYVLER